MLCGMASGWCRCYFFDICGDECQKVICDIMCMTGAQTIIILAVIIAITWGGLSVWKSWLAYQANLYSNQAEIEKKGMELKRAEEYTKCFQMLKDLTKYEATDDTRQ